MTNKQQHAAEETLNIIPLIMRVVAAELRQMEQPLMPPQLAVLNFLVDGPHNLSELAEMSAVRLPTMSGTITKLVNEGYVTRTRAMHDRRVVMLTLTENGRLLLETIGQHLIARLSTLLSPFSEQELTQLLAGLSVLKQVIQTDKPVHTS